MKGVKCAAGGVLAMILATCIGCGQRSVEVHPHTMSAAEYQQNIAKINSDPSIPPVNKQLMIQEFKEHVKVDGGAPAASGK